MLGTQYKVSRFVVDEITDASRYHDGTRELSAKLNVPVAEVDRRARGALDEMVAAQSRRAIALWDQLGRYFSRAYRLDVDTTGLILLTDDGALAHRLTHPSFEVPRTYHAKVRRAPVREDALRALREGVELDDGRTAPARVKRLGADRVELTIHEGRKRQVRRMLEAVGHPVVSLERVRFGPLWLGGLEEGRHRRLTAPEIEKLRRPPR